MLHSIRLVFCIVLLFCHFFHLIPEVRANSPEPENLARTARVSASSEFSDDYSAKWAVDGNVPFALSKNDARKAWAIRGHEGIESWFKLQWRTPKKIAEVIYYPRTGVLLEEGFKDYELYLDDDTQPLMSGSFEMQHGPQRITLPEPKIAKMVTIKFLNSFPGTVNPGASEIAVYSDIPSETQLWGVTLEKQSPDEKDMLTDLNNGDYGFDQLLVIKRHHLSITHVYTYHVEGYKPGGGLCIYTPPKKDAPEGELKQIVDSSDGMILDASLHWNGEDIVFSWKRGKSRIMIDAVSNLKDISCGAPEDNYQIWTVKVDGTGLRQLTNTPYNNLNACWLPDGGIAFISDRKPAYAYCYVVTSPVLYRMDRDGSNQKRLSANYLMDFTPSVMNDGRIIYTRWEYVDRAACPIQSLWTINPDGTGLSAFFGNRLLAPGTFMDARAIPNSQKIIALATNHNGDCTGGIVIIDRTHGPNAIEGVVNTTEEVDIFNPGGQWGNGLYGPYEKPFPLNEELYLVSKSGAIQLRTVDGKRATVLPQDYKTGLGFYSVQPIFREKQILPPIAQATIYDDSVVLPEDGSVSGNWAIISMQDVYLGIEPTIKRGDVKQIAVVQEVEKGVHSPQIRVVPGTRNQIENIAAFGFQFPLVSCGATYSAKKLWGYADVMEDGSACFMVPSELPIYFLALDAEGRAVQRMRSFTHLMPGEVQGCVGCHAERNTLTPSRDHLLPQRRHPQELIEPVWGVKGFSYQEVVQPVWDKYCLDCHNPYNKEGGIDLSGDYTDFFNVSYDLLARKGTLGERQFRVNGVARDSHAEGESPYTSWLWTINGSEWNILETAPLRWGSPASLLTKLIAQGHPDKEGKQRVVVALEYRKRVNMWIDLNVPYYPTSASNHREQIGCRRMYPLDLDATLADVGSRRCAECHADNIPREFYTRFMNPEKNAFLLAPLAKSAGGTEKCGKAVFANTEDADYQRLLRTFEPVKQLIRERSRADMPDFMYLECAK